MTSKDAVPVEYVDSLSMKWGIGLGCELVIVLSSLFGFLLIPFLKKPWFPVLLTGLVGLAVGTLAGTGVLTLFPDAFDIVEKYEDDNTHIWKGLGILGGLYFFFLTERIVKIATIGSEAAHGHSQNSATANKNMELPQKESLPQKKESKLDDVREMTKFERQASEATIVSTGSQIQLVSAKSTENLNGGMTNGVFYIGDGNMPDIPGNFAVETVVQNVTEMDKASNKVPLIAWVLSLGEGFHHLIDGIIVGVAFSQNVFGGISIAVSILCEEFSHKLGDYAILLSAGMKPCKAMLFNFLQSSCNLLGFIGGMFLGEKEGAAGWMYAVAAGMFVYLAYIEMVPELDKTLHDQKTKADGAKVFFVQNVGILTGEHNCKTMWEPINVEDIEAEVTTPTQDTMATNARPGGSDKTIADTMYQMMQVMTKMLLANNEERDIRKQEMEAVRELVRNSCSNSSQNERVVLEEELNEIRNQRELERTLREEERKKREEDRIQERRRIEEEIAAREKEREMNETLRKEELQLRAEELESRRREWLMLLETLSEMSTSSNRPTGAKGSYIDIEMKQLQMKEFKVASQLRRVYNSDAVKHVQYLHEIGNIHRRMGELIHEPFEYMKAVAIYECAIAHSEGCTQEVAKDLKEKLETDRNMTLDLFYQQCTGRPLPDDYIDLDRANKRALVKIREKMQKKLNKLDDFEEMRCYVEGLSEKDTRKKETKRVKEIGKLYVWIFKEMKEFISSLVKQCEEALNIENLQYALVSFGSYSRKETTPMSDVEFAAVEKTNVTSMKSTTKDTLKNLVLALHMKILALGETVLPALAIPSLNDFTSSDKSRNWYFDKRDGVSLKKGISFDGLMPGANKTPYYTKSLKDRDFCLLNTMGAFIKCYHEDDISDLTFLFKGDFETLHGDPEVAEKMKSIFKADGEQRDKIRKEIKTEMAADLKKYSCIKQLYDRKYNRHATASEYDVKKEFYRLPSVVISNLLHLYKCDQSCFWEVDSIPGVHDDNLHQLKMLLASAAELRLRCYSYHNGQVDRSEGRLFPDFLVGENVNANVFLERLILRYYMTAIPLVFTIEEQDDGASLYGSLETPRLYDPSLINQVIAYIMMKKTTKAVQLLKKANENYKHESPTKAIMHILCNIYMNDTAESKGFCDKLRIHVYNDKNTSEMDVLGVAYSQSKEYESAMQLHKDALKIKESEEKSDKKVTVQLLADTFLMAGDTEQYIDLATKYPDLIYSEKDMQQLKTLHQEVVDRMYKTIEELKQKHGHETGQLRIAIETLKQERLQDEQRRVDKVDHQPSAAVAPVIDNKELHTLRSTITENDQIIQQLKTEKDESDAKLKELASDTSKMKKQHGEEIEDWKGRLSELAARISKSNVVYQALTMVEEDFKTKMMAQEKNLTQKFNDEKKHLQLRIEAIEKEHRIELEDIERKHNWERDAMVKKQNDIVEQAEKNLADAKKRHLRENTLLLKRIDNHTEKHEKQIEEIKKSHYREKTALQKNHNDEIVELQKRIDRLKKSSIKK
ncbi:unnamed protein product [Owenia fusiformis]|uniref:Uncharacterized protein n=1 Tax=Owenia fusiformis TaxID=6347 RepID=A0A8J1XUA9_OWEFU|nr:unnamed protein product [Owenia fusiformis]